jgi:hypothetical protein
LAASSSTVCGSSRSDCCWLNTLVIFSVYRGVMDWCSCLAVLLSCWHGCSVELWLAALSWSFHSFSYQSVRTSLTTSSDANRLYFIRCTGMRSRHAYMLVPQDVDTERWVLATEILSTTASQFKGYYAITSTHRFGNSLTIRRDTTNPNQAHNYKSHQTSTTIFPTPENFLKASIALSASSNLNVLAIGGWIWCFSANSLSSMHMSRLPPPRLALTTKNK